MFSAPVPFKHGEHQRKDFSRQMSQNLYVITVSLHSPAGLACSSAAAFLQLVSAR
jgi:hypothetical protein